jgi:hypothetical protein
VDRDDVGVLVQERQQPGLTIEALAGSGPRVRGAHEGERHVAVETNVVREVHVLARDATQAASDLEPPVDDRKPPTGGQSLRLRLLVHLRPSASSA